MPIEKTDDLLQYIDQKIQPHWSTPYETQDFPQFPAGTYTMKLQAVSVRERRNDPGHRMVQWDHYCLEGPMVGQIYREFFAFTEDKFPVDRFRQRLDEFGFETEGKNAKVMIDYLNQLEQAAPTYVIRLIDRPNTQYKNIRFERVVEGIKGGPPPVSKEEEVPFFGAGDRIMVRLEEGEFPGTVKEVELEDRSVFVRYDDGEEGWASESDVEPLVKEKQKQTKKTAKAKK
jgi:hypothetical protein